MKKGSMNRNTFQHVLIFLAMNLCLAGSAQAVAFYVAKQDISLYTEADVSSEVIATAERGWALRSSNVDTGADWVEIYMLDPLNNGDWEYVYHRYGLPGKNVFVQRKDVKLVESTLQSGHNVPEFDEKKVSRFGFASLLMGGFLDGKWVDAEHLQGKRSDRRWGYGCPA